MNDIRPKQTVCLCIDLKRSTSTGLALSTTKFDQFNLALVRQLGPHLTTVGLEDALVKFTGDGWLIMSDETDMVDRFCCLALIMGHRFRDEIAESAKIDLDKVPPLRIAIGHGRDLPITLPDGSRDYVGDSVRRAVRACQFCHDNEILIDGTTYDWVHHDFEASHVDVPARQEEHPSAKMEEIRTLFRLTALKVESAEESDAPGHLVSTLNILGQGEQATALAGQLSTTLKREATDPHADRTDLLERYNQLLATNLDYGAATRLWKDMRTAGLHPDIRTFHALITKADSDHTRNIWLQRMKQEGVQPTIATFNILVEQSFDDTSTQTWLRRMKRAGIAPDAHMLNTILGRLSDFTVAQGWLEIMEKQGVVPNAATYDLLIARSVDMAVATELVDRMISAGIEPTQMTLAEVFSKDVNAITADRLLGWYLSLAHHPADLMQRAMKTFRAKGRLDEVLRLCLDYPNVQFARSIFKKHTEASLSYFLEILNTTPNHANGAYAMGVALMTNERWEGALVWLRRAYNLAGPGPRREELHRYLTELETRTPLSTVEGLTPPA